MTTGPDIRLATSDQDFDAARLLCQGFVDWCRATFPEKRAVFDSYFPDDVWRRTLADLPVIHARPGGAILLATWQGEPAGTISYKPLAPGTAEVKRLFVIPAARGTGTGRALVAAMIEAARGDGYAALQLDTGRFLAAAQGLYAAHGFAVFPTPPGAPAGADAVYMHRVI